MKGGRPRWTDTMRVSVNLVLRIEFRREPSLDSHQIQRKNEWVVKAVDGEEVVRGKQVPRRRNRESEIPCPDTRQERQNSASPVAGEEIRVGTTDKDEDRPKADTRFSLTLNT
jgi:hypothetical protein